MDDILIDKTATGVDSEELKENADSYLKLEVLPYDGSSNTSINIFKCIEQR